MITLPVGFITGSSIDPDAQLFIETAGNLSDTEAAAINTLVKSLKGAGIWSKINTAYPFVGGTAASCSLNLVAPVDATYTLGFNGDWTINSSGVKPTTTDAGNFADTGWRPSIFNDNHHVYRYVNQVNDVGCGYAGAGPSPYVIMGACQELEWFDGNATVSGGGIVDGTDGFSQAISRENATTAKFYRKLDGGSWTLVTTQTVSSVALPSDPMYIGAINNLGSFSEQMRYGFASYGYSLTEAEMSSLDSIVTTFNTTLGRNF